MFKPTDETNGSYLISHDGRFKKPDIINYWGKREEHILSTHKGKGGYLKINFSVHGYRFDYFVHKLVAKYFLTNSNNYKNIVHIDGDKTNNCYTNLVWSKYTNEEYHRRFDDLEIDFRYGFV